LPRRWGEGRCGAEAGGWDLAGPTVTRSSTIPAVVALGPIIGPNVTNATDGGKVVALGPVRRAGPPPARKCALADGAEREEGDGDICPRKATAADVLDDDEGESQEKAEADDDP
jgi:hypothetical protein